MFSQEFISIAIVFAFCVALSVCCLFIWFIRCRKMEKISKNQQRNLELDDYEIQIPKKKGTPFNARKVHEGAKDAPKRQESVGKGESAEKERNERRDSNVAADNETMEQFENRVREQFSPLQTIKEVGTPIRNKRLDTISVTAKSTDTLQRNDSKTNVFPVETNTADLEEIDLNPGLNSPINLETI